MDTTLNLEAGAAGAAAGAQLAADHADKATDTSWSARAMLALLQFAKARPSSAFMTEDARAAAEKNGLPLPPDRRAWGHVVRAASAAGHIQHVGYDRQKAANCHSSPKSLWMLAA